jgi:Tol biopolymer transport system component/Zn-dependent M28 family amino/carboxypeptidase
MRGMRAAIPVLLVSVCVCFAVWPGRAEAQTGGAADVSGAAEPNEAAFLKNIRQLVLQGGRSGEGYFSQDGKQLIFQSEREQGNPFYQIYVLDLESGESHRVSPGKGKTTCSFFRPGTDEVLFASTHLDPKSEELQKAEIEFRESGQKHRYAWDYDEHFDIFSCKRDGTGIKRLTDAPGYDAEGAYSPDGSKIVFGSIRDAYPVGKLSKDDQKRLEMDASYFAEIMNADGSAQTRLTEWPGYDGGPFFTPDGERIVWRHFDESGMLADIYTMRLDGTDRRRLTDFGAMSWAPYFHPSNEYVIFASNKLGFSNFELYMVDAQGRHEPVRVTTTDGFDGLPIFSPDGKRLAWTSNRTPQKKAQIFIAEWNHDAAVAAIAASPLRAGAGESAFSPEITAADLREEVGFLASDRLEGRMTGSKGTKLASDYIAAYLEKIGVEPLGDNGTYFQEFPFTSGMKIVPDQCLLEVTAEKTSAYKIEKDFRPVAFSSTEEAEGEVVFAGYGLAVPGDLEHGYDSYAGLDVKDKIVLVLQYVPESVSVERRQELNHYAGLRYKAMTARERGAKALLVVTGPNSIGAGALVPVEFDQSSASSGVIVVSVSGAVADALFASSGKKLADVQSELDLESPHAEGAFALPGVKVKVAAAVEREKKSDRNVLGLLPAAGGLEGAEFVMLGAHYDHIGHGEIGSLADKDAQKEIHNGADDNASGTSLVMELAGSLAEKRRADPGAFKKGVVFAFWSGEELGVIGSSYFTENPAVPLEKIAAYVNFDMVGRMRDNKLTLQAVGSSKAWPELIEKRNVAAGFNLTLQEDPYLPTDATALYAKGVPVLSFFTGVHDDYNKPTDDPETLHYDDMARIGAFALALAGDLSGRAEKLDFVKVEKSKAQTGMRGSLSAYLGTIPDYASEDAGGVKLTGVRSNGPADKAGVKGGDVIVELAGQKITNIYDYTYALGGLKIGQPVEMVVLRNGERVKITVIPEPRP